MNATNNRYQASIEADPTLPIIRITRDFDATPAQLMRAHTDPELFARWVGPNGMETKILDWDATTGGRWRYVAGREGEEYGFHGCFHEVGEDRIVQTFTFDGQPNGVALETLWFEDIGDGRTRLHAQSLVASFFYELPVGRGKRYLSQGGVTDRVLGGWYVSGVLSYHSGLPTEVYSNCGGTAGDILFAGCHFTGLARVNVVPGVPQTNKSHFNPFTTPFWNPAAFMPADAFSFGNEGRSLPSARTFGAKSEDITIGKKTHLYGERGTIDFRASFFNVFNRHIFQAPGGFSPNLNTPFTPAGGEGCKQALACGFGAVTDTSGPRTIQFGLRIEY